MLTTTAENVLTGNVGLEKAFTGLKNEVAGSARDALGAGKDLARAAILNLINS